MIHHQTYRYSYRKDFKCWVAHYCYPISCNLRLRICGFGKTKELAKIDLKIRMKRYLKEHRDP